MGSIATGMAEEGRFKQLGKGYPEEKRGLGERVCMKSLWSPLAITKNMNTQRELCFLCYITIYLRKLEAKLANNALNLQIIYVPSLGMHAEDITNNLFQYNFK